MNRYRWTFLLVRWWIVAAILLGLATAQIVRVENFSPVPFSGWKRTTIDVMPPHLAGTVGQVRYVVGRAVGRDTRVVDVHVTLAPGQAQSIDLAAGQPATWTRGPLPADLLGHFGGPTTFAGQPMVLAGLIEDGAGYTAQFRGRAGRMLCCTAWITWYPDQPAWADGEAIVVASNPAVPDLTEVAPAGLDLRFGDALVIVPGRGLAPLVAAGTPFGDGQGRATPLTFVWLRHLTSASNWSSVGCAADLGIGAVGISRLLPEGNPSFPASFSARGWAGARFATAVRKLSTWEAPILGPAPVSGVTGGQEDHLFHPGGEALQANGVAAATVRYLAALHLHSARPCNHLEVDGRALLLDLHPDLRFWDSRVHWHTGVSSDRLGKPRSLTIEEANGFWGADTQHWLTSTLVASARLTGSPACQRLMWHMATAYLLQRTLDGSTAGIWSAREVGYECLWAVACDRDLEDRSMAARVVARWRARMRDVVAPKIGSGDIIATQLNHWGPGEWYAPWEQSLAAYGLDLSARHLAEPALLPLAKRLADRALRDGWAQVGSQWVTRPMFPVSVDATTPPAGDGSFNRFGMPLAPWVVLRQEPTNAKARAVWDYLLSDPNGARNWMPPGVTP